MKYRDLLDEVQRLLNWKGKPDCFEYDRVLYCWCGKCKPKEYKLPDNFSVLLAKTAVERYRKLKTKSTT